MMQIVAVVGLNRNMLEPKTFLILGDSWSQGELEYKKFGPGHDILHKGVEQYLLDENHVVINHGILGGSNSQAFLKYNQFINHADFVIWFQTDPLRDVSWNYERLFIEPLKQFKSIKSVFEYVIVKEYSKFNSIAAMRNQTVYVIGGFSVVIPEINKFSNLKTIIPNVSGLIDSSTNFNYYGYFIRYDWFVNIVEYCKKQNIFDEDDLNKLKQEYIDMAEENCRIVDYMRKNKKFYWPDGAHPNRDGHKIIFNKIKEELLDA